MGLFVPVVRSRSWLIGPTGMQVRTLPALVPYWGGKVVIYMATTRSAATTRRAKTAPKPERIESYTDWAVEGGEVMLTLNGKKFSMDAGTAEDIASALRENNGTW